MAENLSGTGITARTGGLSFQHRVRRNVILRLPYAGVNGLPSSVTPSQSNRDHPTLPIQLFRHIRAAEHIDRDLPAFPEAKPGNSA